MSPWPAGGKVVRQWTPDEIRSRCQSRRSIERIAIEWAVRRATVHVLRFLRECCDRADKLFAAGRVEETLDLDVLFHTALIHASCNAEIVRAASLLPLAGAFMPTPDQNLARDMDEAFGAHQRLTDLILEEDVDGASALVVSHLDFSAERIARWLENRIVEGAASLQGAKGSLVFQKEGQSAMSASACEGAT